MVETTEHFTMKELDILKHDDLRKFAVSQGIEIPAEISTKKALVPYLYEILNKPPEANKDDLPEETNQTDEQMDEDSSDEEFESTEDNAKETVSDQEPTEDEEEHNRYIRTETANGVLVYDRKTHSAEMEPRG